MLKFFIFSLFLFWTFSSIGQTAPTVECATVAKSSWINKFQSISNNRSTAQKTSQLVTIPVQIHLIVKANGITNLTVQQIRNELVSVNQFYSNANMVFYECLAPEIIYDDSLYNYEYDTEESILLSQHYTNDVINIYFANTASVNGTQVCGYSQFPPSVDYAVMAASCSTNGSTLAHELGHYFGLFHTHGDISQGELVDGSNCSSDGDLICDTPADPVLSSSNVNSSCVYTGTALDANSMPYAPDVTNIMSYSRKVCRNTFSVEQYYVINSVMQTERSNLYCQSVTAINNHTKNSINLFPNPGRDEIALMLPNAEQQVEFKLFNTLGVCVFSDFFSGKIFQINTSKFASGVYFYTAQSDAISLTGKWIKSE
jgi:hypothetical protein